LIRLISDYFILHLFKILVSAITQKEQPSAQEKHGAVGAGPEEGHINDQRAVALLL